jgi:Ras-related GTP-binding protein A/B
MSMCHPCVCLCVCHTVFNERKEELEQAAGDQLKLKCFGTSIWDETLYKAWSSIVYTLVPNIDYLQKQLGKLCRVVEADEVVLFEKATFLVISKATLSEHDDVHRYEKISNIIKQVRVRVRECVCVCVH